LSEPTRTVTAAVLTPHGDTGLDVVFLGPPAPELEEDRETEAPADGRCSSPARFETEPEPVAVAAAAPAETDGVGHTLHEVRT
ncbi:hypothetical protein ABTD97_20440, partial [Acinetobacter baumannii]